MRFWQLFESSVHIFYQFTTLLSYVLYLWFLCNQHNIVSAFWNWWLFTSATATKVEQWTYFNTFVAFAKNTSLESRLHWSACGENVITVINAHSRPQPWLVLVKCTDFCPAHYWAFVCKNSALLRSGRVSACICATVLHRERWLPLAAREHLGSTVILAWAPPLSLSVSTMCALPALSAKQRCIPHTITNSLRHFGMLRCRLHSITRLGPKDAFFCRI